jgi:dCMP deaminase
MGMAWMWASMSKDPSTQIGAVIVSADNRPLGSGYNGPPRQIPDSEIDWARPFKYKYIRHAERNALDFCSEAPIGATIYVTGNPCPDCMNDIVTEGISKVIYFPCIADKSSMLARQDEWLETQDIAKKGKVELIQFKGNLNWMRDWNDFLYHKGVFN